MTAPSLAAASNNPSFTEGASAVDLFNSVAADVNDSGETFATLVITIDGVVNGASETLRVNGTPVALTNGNSGSVAGIGSYSVSLTGGTATLTLTGMALSNAQMDSLVDDLAYHNASQNPGSAARTVTLTSITDSGNINSTTALNLVSTVGVTPVNNAPMANDDIFTTPEDVAVTLALPLALLLANDTDPEGDALSVSLLSSAQNGTLSVVGGNLVFTPTANYHGPASFVYTIRDPSSATSTATVRITVTSENDPSALTPDTLSSPEDTDAIGSVLSNDSDVDDALTVMSFSVSGMAGTFAADQTVNITGKGELTLRADGSYNFKPVADWNGAVPQVTYAVNTGGSSTLDITITPVNDAPVAKNDIYTTAVDTPISWPLPLTVFTANDTDVDGDVLSVTIVSSAQNGTISVIGGQLTFTPNSGFTGLASLSYVMKDTSNAIANATVYIAVGIPIPPATLVADTKSAAEDSHATGNVLTNDTDLTGALTVATFSVAGIAGSSAAGQTISIPGTGQITIFANGNYDFSPEANWNGVVPQVTYSDGSGGSSTLDITVTSVNDAPSITAPASLSAIAGTSGALSNISFSDVDVGGGQATVTISVPSGILGATSGGGVTVGGTSSALTLSASISDINSFIAAGGIHFTPAIGSAATVTLAIAIDDGGNTGADPGVSGTATSEAASTTVSLNVAPAANAAPVNAVPQAQSVSQNGALVFSAGNGNPISISDQDAGSNPIKLSLKVLHGTLSLGSVSGLSFTTGDGTGDAELVFTGTLANISAALVGLSYVPQAGYSGSDTLLIETDDNGNTGSGGNKLDNDTVAIAVNAISVPDDPSPPTPSPVVTPVDGVLLSTQPGPNGSTIIAVPVVPSTRPDSPNSSSPLADIPIVRAFDGHPIVQVSLPAGVGLEAEGRDSSSRGLEALAELGLRIERIAGSNNELFHSGEVFYASLSPTEALHVQIIKPIIGAGFNPSIPLVIAGSARSGDGKQAIIVDARTLPPGTTIQVDDIDFVAVVGQVRLVGGKGDNSASGDAGAQWIVLGPGSDIIHGGGGNDTVGSEGGDDQVYGDAGDDIVFGGAGNDLLSGGSGSDRLNGGTGFDVALQEGKRTDYSLTLEAGGIKLTHIASGVSDWLVDVEQVRFETGPILNVAHSAAEEASAYLFQKWLGRDLTQAEGAVIQTIAALTALEVSTAFAQLFPQEASGKTPAQLLESMAGASSIRVDEIRDVIVNGDKGNNTISPTLGLARYVDGGAGIDTVVVPATLAQTHIQANGGGSFTVQRMTDGAMLDLTGVERISFSDTKLALDLNGNAGQAAKLLGVLGGQSLLTNKALVGETIRALDAGVSAQSLAGIGLQALKVQTPDQVAQLLWTQLTGRAGTAQELQPLVDLMGQGVTGAELAVFASNLELNSAHIDLVGLSARGIEFAWI